MSERAAQRNIIGDCGRALLIVALFTYPLLAGKDFRWQNVVMHCLVSAAVLLWYVGDTRQGRQVALVRHRTLDWALPAFLGIVCIAAAGSAYKYASIVFITWLLDCLLAYWMAREAFTEKRWRWAVPVGLLAAAAVCALMGLREYVRNVMFLEGATWRIFGPLYNPNILAAYLIGPFLIAIGLISSSPEAPEQARPSRKQDVGDELQHPRYGKIALGFAILLIGPAILLTGSRAGFIALFIGAGLFALLTAGRGRGRKQTAIIGGGLLVVMLVAVLTVPPLRNRLQRSLSLDSHSAAFRYYTWLGTLDMIRDKPVLGAGPGSFEYAYPAYARTGFTRMAHQSYLQIAAEGGIGALLAAIVAGIAALWLCMGAARGRSDCAGAIAAAAGEWLAALAVHNLVDYSLYVPAVAVSAFALLGAAAGAALPAPSLSGGASRRFGGLGIVLIAIFGASCWLLAGEALTVRSGALLDARRYYDAEDSARAAVSALPISAESWEALAEVYEAQVRSPDSPFLPKAMEARQQALRRTPTSAKNYIALARLYHFKGQVDESVEYAEKAVDVYPTNPRGLAELGQLLEQVGRRADARAAYERLLKLLDGPVGKYAAVPELPDVSYAWAWAYLAEDAYAGGNAPAGTQMVYDALDLLCGRLRGEQLQFEVARKTTGKRPAGLGELDALADRIAPIVWEYPDLTNMLRLAEVRGLLGQWSTQEALLLDVAARSRSAPEQDRVLLGGIAYLQLGALYKRQGLDAKAKGAYADGLRLLREIQADALEKAITTRGRRPIGVEGLHALIESAGAEGD